MRVPGPEAVALEYHWKALDPSPPETETVSGTTAPAAPWQYVAERGVETVGSGMTVTVAGAEVTASHPLPL
jgi:hypothetical protein